MDALELQELGFTKKEASVYLATLELGASAASIIARKAGIDRVNCYHLLENLMRKGFVSSFVKSHVRMFSAENPKKLVSMFEEKMHKARRLLPELLSMTNTLTFKPKIQFFEGIEGVKNIFLDTLTAKSEIVGYTNLKALIELLPNFLADYSKAKIKNHIKTRLISPGSPDARTFIDKYYPRTKEARRLIELFFVNPEQFNFENEIDIFENKVAIMSLNSQELIGVIIESTVLARTMKRVFDLSWLGATSFVAQ